MFVLSFGLWILPDFSCWWTELSGLDCEFKAAFIFSRMSEFFKKALAFLFLTIPLSPYLPHCT